MQEDEIGGWCDEVNQKDESIEPEQDKKEDEDAIFVDALDWSSERREW